MVARSYRQDDSGGDRFEILFERLQEGQERGLIISIEGKTRHCHGQRSKL